MNFAVKFPAKANNSLMQFHFSCLFRFMYKFIICSARKFGVRGASYHRQQTLM